MEEGKAKGIQIKVPKPETPLPTWELCTSVQIWFVLGKRGSLQVLGWHYSCCTMGSALYCLGQAQ